MTREIRPTLKKPVLSATSPHSRTRLIVNGIWLTAVLVLVTILVNRHFYQMIYSPIALIGPFSLVGLIEFATRYLERYRVLDSKEIVEHWLERRGTSYTLIGATIGLLVLLVSVGSVELSSASDSPLRIRLSEYRATPADSTAWRVVKEDTLSPKSPTFTYRWLSLSGEVLRLDVGGKDFYEPLVLSQGPGSRTKLSLPNDLTPKRPRLVRLIPISGLASKLPYPGKMNIGFAYRTEITIKNRLGQRSRPVGVDSTYRGEILLGGEERYLAWSAAPIDRPNLLARDELAWNLRFVPDEEQVRNARMLLRTLHNNSIYVPSVELHQGDSIFVVLSRVAPGEDPVPVGEAVGEVKPAVDVQTLLVKQVEM